MPASITQLAGVANAPVQARWANAQRAGPAPPNPPTVACNRLLASMVRLSTDLLASRQVLTLDAPLDTPVAEGTWSTAWDRMHHALSMTGTVADPSLLGCVAF